LESDGLGLVSTPSREQANINGEMKMTDTHIIEINGVKLEVDLRTAKRVENLQVGSRVKVLVKKYNDEYEVNPGVIVGFEPFENLPSIVVAYVESDYSTANIKFKSFNTKTKDFEIVADIDFNAIEVNKNDILARMDREIERKQIEVQELQQKRTFFLDKFGTYFNDAIKTFSA
jgi:hypothetical protein